jgi:hypothetical protein
MNAGEAQKNFTHILVMLLRLRQGALHAFQLTYSLYMVNLCLVL